MPGGGVGADAATTDFAVSMQHVHLPKLATHGFVEWHRDAGEVTRGPAFEGLVPLLEVLQEFEGEHPRCVTERRSQRGR